MSTNGTMKTYKNTAIIVGALFLIAMVTSLVGGAGMIEPVIGTDEYLVAVSESDTQVLVGVLLELINGICVVLIAVLLFPILKKVNEGLALGYVAFRIIESMVIVAAVVSPLTLVALSQEYLKAGAPDTSFFQALGGTLLAARSHWAGLLLGLFFSLGALVLYYLMYKSILLPRFISIWGFIGAILILVWNTLQFFGIDLGDAGMILALPIILNEIFMAIWLIVKGFNAPAITSLSQ